MSGKPVRTQWTQLDFYTAWDRFLAEKGTTCDICGFPVDGLNDQIASELMENLCDIEGCPQSTGPTTTTAGGYTFGLP